MPDFPELPPVAGQPVSVVLLTHNAGGEVEGAVGAWAAYLDTLGREYELLLVDDGSSDGTAAAAESLPARLPRLRVFRHVTRRGIGAALRTALAEARHPLFLYTTADRRYEPADLKRLLEDIDRVHVVSGFRAWQRVPFVLRAAGMIWRLFLRVVFGIPVEPLPGWLGWRAEAYHWVTWLLFGLRIVDVNSAFKLFRRDALARIPIQSDGPFVHTEVLAKLNFLGCWMTEAPVSYRPGEAKGAVEEAVLARQFRQEGRAVFAHPDFGVPSAPDTAKVAEGAARASPSDGRASP
jgi:glycosyltransferase involved in cell wall biosynthesis